MTDGQKPNKPLFSQHYLEHRIQECPEWQVDMAAGLGALKKLYLSKKELLPTLSEAQTEDVFIKPALDILGFSHIPQVTTRGKGRAERPDYALFASEDDRDAAYSLQKDESAFYARVRAIAEAKYWERPLSKVSSNDKRDIYKNENPSFQISSYLTGTGVDWGILTNGREWRLYYRQASSTATEFYPVDLVELLEAGDLERFKYFWLFFRQEALVKDAQGRNFLERVREGSTTYATQVGNELKALVFDRIFPGLAGGFVVDARRRGEQVTSEQVYEATLSFLYKLLFLLYAEARNLLPIDRDYRDYSLIKMTQEVALGMERQKKLSQTSTGLYDRLLSLFQIVDRGDAGLEVPRYDGGLFHFDFSQPSDRIEYRANYFLSRFKLSDAVLAPVLDRLARFEGQPIDYGFLGVRQLGSIYEGLLEYRVAIEDASGNVHLENDKGERKATGSYYTPDYIVKYIVSHTLKPILEQRQARFGELMAQIIQLHTQLEDKRLGAQSLNGMRKDLQRLEREAQSTLLDIKVCDPAMGSGHFLVEAVDYLTDELIRILTLYPEQNPVMEMLEQTRQSILQNLKQQGITINPDRLEPTQLLQRVVMKRCIYGVDLNVMAVELAKVSLWLHSFTIGAPLSFLDHHLRCGNSLIGTTAREAEAAMSQESGGQLNLLSGPFVGLLLAAEIMRGVSVLSDATFAEVEQSETLFRSFDEAAKPYKRLLDIYVSKFFGLKRAEHFLRVYGTSAIAADSKTMNAADAAVYDDALKLSDEKHFFHWDLEFPEVFIDLENASWKENPGFDAVVGNPPWGGEFSVKDKGFLQVYYKTDKSSNVDSYSIFTKLAVQRTNTNGVCGYIIPDTLLRKDDLEYLRKFLLFETEIMELIETGPLFKEVRDTWCLIILVSHRKPSKYHRINHKQISRFIVSAEERLEAFSHHNWSRQSKTAQIYWQNRPKLVIGYSSSRREQKVIRIIESLSTPLKNNPFKFVISRGEEGSKFNLKQDSNSKFWMVIPEQIERYCTDDGIKISEESLTSNKIKNYYKHPKVWVIRIQKMRWLQRVVSAFDERDNSAGMKTLQVIISQSDNEKNLLFLSTLLSSNLINFWCSDYLVDDINQSYLERIPIRNVSFTTPIDRRQQALQNTIALYNQLQLNHNADPLLVQVNHHLNQQPEEADVIHDLLAHLAEQMIELNKQKQTEIKSFLHWLERFIGCPIDTLTNKSKVQNYLGDYYKKGTGIADTDNDTGAPHLSFNDLIELLKKNKRKIKIDPVARKEQQTLEKEYQASLETLLPLKMQLMRCDRLIDAIVYKLYRLTEEEIAIVEGRDK